MKTMTLSMLALCLSITALHAQWEQSSGLTALDIHALAVDPDSSGTIYAGTERGVYGSKNNGESWLMMNDGLKYNHVSSIAVKNGRLLAGSFDRFDRFAGHGPDGDVSLSIDGGRSWTSIDGGRYWVPTNNRMAARGAVGLGFCSSGFLAATGSGIFRTTDTGATWMLASPNKEFDNLSVAPCGMFAGSSFDGPYRSPDSGKTWQKMDVGVKCNHACIACSGSAIYIAAWIMKEIRKEGELHGVRSESALFCSPDAGEHWSAIPMPPAPIIKGIYASGDTLIASFISSDPEQGGITVHSIQRKRSIPLKIEDGGISLHEDDTPAISHEEAFSDSREGPAGIHVSIDGGRTWTVVNDGLPVTSISTLTVRDGYVFAGTYIAGLFRRPMSELVAAAKAGRK